MTAAQLRHSADLIAAIRKYEPKTTRIMPVLKAMDQVIFDLESAALYITELEELIITLKNQ